MTFGQKLSRLTEDRNKTRIATEAGLPPTAISNYISKGNLPIADTALKLAKALGVTTDWLIDDRQDWPPPPHDNATSLTTDELARELGRRMAGVGVMMYANIVRADKTNWVDVAKQLLAADPDAPLPKSLQRIAEIPAELNGMATQLRHYDPHAMVTEHAPPELLREVRPDHEFSLLDLHIRHRNLDDLPGYEQAFRLSAMFLLPREFRGPFFDEGIKYTRDRVIAELAKLEGTQAAWAESKSPTTKIERNINIPLEASRKVHIKRHKSTSRKGK